MRACREDGMWYYFVHYNGWNKKYDTWVEDAGLIKMPAGDPGAGVGGCVGLRKGASNGRWVLGKGAAAGLDGCSRSARGVMARVGD